MILKVISDGLDMSSDEFSDHFYIPYEFSCHFIYKRLAKKEPGDDPPGPLHFHFSYIERPLPLLYMETSPVMHVFFLLL